MKQKIGRKISKLWYFTSATIKAKTNYNSSTHQALEPGTLNYKLGSPHGELDGLKIFNKSNYSSGGLQGYTKDSLYKELQSEYDSTIESVEKYGGFYIGRYETGDISKNIPVIKRMNTDINMQSWYTMYPKMKNISSNVNIQTSMIWGCLWDETLQWLIDTGNKTYADMTNSTSWGNYNDATFEYKANTNGGTETKNKNNSKIIPTGSADYTKANNIYDLAGNVADWSLEANSEYGRSSRGHNYWVSGGYGPAPYRYYDCIPTRNDYGYRFSRILLH